MKQIAIAIALTSGLAAIPSIGVAQSCIRTEVAQEFSYADTLNSSGSPLTEAHAVFQQDRFYVNQQNRLDPNDKTDPVMVTRDARANYGEAIRSYMNSNAMANMPVEALIGGQYVVELEACGPRDAPSIEIISMRAGGGLDEGSRDFELEHREAELAEWERRLNQREADLNAWERQLGEWDRRISDMRHSLERREQDLNQAAQPAMANAGYSLITGVPDTMFPQAGGSCNLLISQARALSSEFGLSVFSNRNGRWSSRSLGTDACLSGSSDRAMCNDFEGTAPITEMSSEPLVLQLQTRGCTSINEFIMTNGAGQAILRNTEALCPSLYRVMPEITTNVIECR